MFLNRLDLEQRAERELYPTKTFKYKNAEVRVVFHGNKVSYVAEDIYSWFYDSEIEALSAITRSEYGRSISIFHKQDIESSIVPITELGVRNLLKYVIPKTDFCIGFVNWILFELIPSVRKMQTSTALHMFIFEELSSVRVLPINGSAWFAAKDVCDILGLTDPTKAIATLKDKEKRVLTGTELRELSHNPNTINVPTTNPNSNDCNKNIFDGIETTRLSLISESGLYRLIFKSRKPSAERFKDWVFEDVLPTIRLKSYYMIDPELAQKDSKIKELENKLMIMERNQDDLIKQKLKSIIDSL